VRSRSAALLACLLLATCAEQPKAPPGPGTTPATRTFTATGPEVVDPHVPLFASRPYEPFRRADAVAIALREWRLFGQPIDDDPPGTRPEPLPENKPERQAGLWERVGEYWWIGQPPDEREVNWTGIHDEFGNVFPADVDGHYAWSAAFISYVMRIAGAGGRFPYAPNHSTYIDAASLGQSPVLRALSPSAYAPAAGDIICTGREGAARLRFADLPTRDLFPAHCDIVVGVKSGELSVIGGNVDDAVTLKHVPVGPDGRLADAAGQVIDTRYPWLVVLQVLYDT
jgi:hypothetical protein